MIMIIGNINKVLIIMILTLKIMVTLQKMYLNGNREQYFHLTKERLH